uniref:Integrase catalytic domain-containing protein n=1 Tax=Caenorhabditis japonica TaxID=281687 RepID=A0A8R1IWS8_CAEJA
MLKTMRIEHKMSTPYHHQANGQVERANQTVEGMLRQCEDENEWDVDLQTLVHAYNNSSNATTEVTPYVVMHGKEARSPLKNALPVEDGSTSVEEHVKNVKSNQEMLQKVCVERIEKKTKKRQEAHDRSINDVEIKVGNKVWIRSPRYNKIGKQFLGPYEVKEVEEPNVTVLISGPKTRSNKENTRKIHKNRCKVYKESEK